MFTNRILERGYHYYLEKRVNNVVKIDNIYHASVEGSETYHVEIEIKPGNKIGYMHCDCPYCKDGHDCKHEVAVLIEIIELWVIMMMNMTLIIKS